MLANVCDINHCDALIVNIRSPHHLIIIATVHFARYTVHDAYDACICIFVRARARYSLLKALIHLVGICNVLRTFCGISTQFIKSRINYY